MKRHLDYVIAWKDCVTQDHFKAVWTVSRGILLLSPTVLSTGSPRRLRLAQPVETFQRLSRQKQRCLTVVRRLSPRIVCSFEGERHSKRVISELQQDGALLSVLKPMMPSETQTSTHSHGHLHTLMSRTKKTQRIYFFIKVAHLECRSPSLPHFLSLSSHTLSITASVNLSPSLVFLLSQLRKSRDYQRNNPRTRGLLLPASA